MGERACGGIKLNGCDCLIGGVVHGLEELAEVVAMVNCDCCVGALCALVNMLLVS